MSALRVLTNSWNVSLKDDKQKNKYGLSWMKFESELCNIADHCKYSTPKELKQSLIYLARAAESQESQ